MGAFDTSEIRRLEAARNAAWERLIAAESEFKKAAGELQAAVRAYIHSADSPGSNR